MRAPAVLVIIGIAAVVLAFVGILLLPHPFGSIVGAVFSAGGIWTVARAEAIDKRRRAGRRQ